MNSLVHFYSIELIYRFLYVGLSFICCVIIILLNIQIFLLIETYPFLQFSNKKFIVTQTTDLIDVVWVLVFSTSYVFVFPLFFYQLILFSKNSWYKYQLYAIYQLFFYSLVVYSISLILCYFSFLPIVLDFLSQWEIKQTTSILNVEIEFRILSYIQWILTIRYVFCFLFYSSVYLYLFFRFLISLKEKYNLLKFHRKTLIFLNTLTLFLIIPSDFFLQFYIIFWLVVVYELVFLFFCYKFYNIIYF